MSIEFKLIEIKNKEQLDGFVGARVHAELLQSWAWGDFQERAGAKIWRLGVEENGKLVATATLIKRFLPFRMSYFYCPRGPISLQQNVIPNSEYSRGEESLKVDNNDKGFFSPLRSVRNDKTRVLEFLFSEIKKIAKKEKVIFLRMEPMEKIDNCKLKIEDSIDVQVSKTIILDLNKLEEELLKEMHQKTRYNIRLAEKKGVNIREAGSDEFEKFWELMSATVNRDGFRLHEKEYYKKMLEVENIKLYFGEFENKILCAGIFSFFGDTAIYLHGASSDENRELMAPHLLQWELIKKAKALGCKYYDFFGIDEKKWPGVTRFKKGFGGEELNYPGTFDIIFNKGKYEIYKFLRKARRLLKF
ncbi:MAG: peptidoglycan bridge formation glycyltransferase FemA/FemB family protein [Patescibacteria group bacterium]|jgi:lipid II:glycine glycyltransferase (peptidoglycan interpeptide bridge formation enzyme)